MTPTSAADLLAEARERTDALLDRGPSASRRRSAAGTAKRWPTRSAPPASGCVPRSCSAAYRAVGRAVAGDRRRRRRGRDRAHLLAGARRPAVHGRRRPPPRPAHHAPPVRRADRHPGRLPAGAGGRAGAGGGRRRARAPARARWAGWPRELFEAGGIEGMVGGQWLDLEAERRSSTLPAAHRGAPGQDRAR